MPGKGNHFEALNRARKVSALCLRIDDTASYCGLDARREGFAVADMLEAWTTKEWEALADNAFVNPPGKDGETVKAVVAEYRRRGALAQQRGAA